MKSPSLDKCQGYAWSFVVALLLLAVWSMLAGMASANGFRQKAACAGVHQQAVAVAAIPYPVVGYQVGQALQQQSVDEYGFRASPSQQRLTFLEGVYEGVKLNQQNAESTEVDPLYEEWKREFAEWKRTAGSDSGDRPTGPPQPPSEGHDATEGGQTTGPQAFSAPQRFLESTGEPLAPGQLESFTETHPLLAANCIACHVDEHSNGGFGIAAETLEAQAKVDAEAILGLITPIAARTMPKGKEITDTERIDAIQELISK